MTHRPHWPPLLVGGVTFSGGKAAATFDRRQLGAGGERAWLPACALAALVAPSDPGLAHRGGAEREAAFARGRKTDREGRGGGAGERRAGGFWGKILRPAAERPCALSQFAVIGPAPNSQTAASKPHLGNKAPSYAQG
jgi:hypothetical protein